MVNKKFNVKGLQAVYKVPELRLVSLQDVDNLNECRLYFDIFLAIGLTMMGVILSKFNWIYFIVALLSLILSIFFGLRGYFKYKKMRDSIK